MRFKSVHKLSAIRRPAVNVDGAKTFCKSNLRVHFIVIYCHGSRWGGRRLEESVVCRPELMRPSRGRPVSVDYLHAVLHYAYVHLT